MPVVKVTEIWQLANAATEDPQVLELTAKSPAFSPVMETVEIVKAVFPVFVSVVTWAGLVVPPMRCAKVNIPGKKLAKKLALVAPAAVATVSAMVRCRMSDDEVPTMSMGYVPTDAEVAVAIVRADLPAAPVKDGGAKPQLAPPSAARNMRASRFH
jgi:hypothetical protein